MGKIGLSFIPYALNIDITKDGTLNTEITKKRGIQH